ncbi:hypothetical protein KORDIASMS9_01843 [Kordia sp. SMS9]|uniref:hypothetical protein n=1 Tax=Kordia sp. SMS9 TaxID=2282170 RepID=UPI000E0D8CC6|nr:hypothetical protein [Kordia sp. SMS9]AXG69618.1 hypothetical protein KORDIASMS9_01843 [Kordia sp. SMS9]
MKQNYSIKVLLVIAVAFFATADNATAQSNNDQISVQNVQISIAAAQIVSATHDAVSDTYEEFACIRDLSVSQQAEGDKFNTNDIVSRTINKSDLTQNGNGYSFYSAIIGYDAYPIVSKVLLQEVSYWLTSRKKRKAAIDQAKSNVVKNLSQIESSEPTFKYSSLYRGMLHVIGQMNKDCKKTVYIYTNGVENYIHNFYDVKDWNAEYETIKKTLLTDMKVPNVKNLEIVFLSSGRDEITVQSLRFWARFFSEHGINTTVRASI